MRKKALTVIGALLIAGSAVQVASASEHHTRKVHRAYALDRDPWIFLNAYDAPYYSNYNYIPQGLQAARQRNRKDFGFGGWDPSRPGDFDPSLNPAD